MDNTGTNNGVTYKDLVVESAEELYENAPCGYISSLPDGTIIKINQTLLQWIGYTREEVLYVKKMQQLFSIGGRIFYETHHAPLMQMQGFINEVNYDIVRKDCTSFPALITSIQLKDSQGNPLLNRTTLFNITERKKYELELLHAKRKAEEATKIKAAFLSTISHEIRTPMNAVIGITDLLIEADAEGVHRDLLNVLKFSTEHLLNLVNDILDFSKIESGKIMLEEKYFNIKDLINSIVYSLGIKAEEKGLGIYSLIDKNLPEFVTGDPVKISQIITNLIGNAIKFTEKGSVTVDLLVREKSTESISIDFSVTDTGIGIPKEKQEQIFEEFRQASYSINQKYGGTGLGLSISRKLLDLYGSQLKVQSEPGKGSTFYFNIRLKQGKQPLQTIPSSKKTGKQIRSLKGVKVLVAEDNEVNVLVLSHFLKNWEVDFEVVENGAKAVEKITGSDYDVVLMDLQMPEMDGYQASTKIRSLENEKYHKLPIIALSAFLRAEIEDKLQAAGINDFVSKPFNSKELFSTIATYASPRLNETPGQIQQKDNSHFRPTDLSVLPAVNLSQYQKLTKGNQDDLNELIRLTIAEFDKFQTASIDALQSGNVMVLEKLIHKSKTAIALLEAKKLDSLIQEATLLLQHEADRESIQAHAAKVDRELNRVISALKNFLQ